MKNEFVIFGLSSALTVTAGLFVRFAALSDNEQVTLDLFDCSRDLFAAAAAVFPAILITADRSITFTPAAGAAALSLIATIFLWAKGDSRYFKYWRTGKRRVKKKDGTLGAAVSAEIPSRMKKSAFVIGNALGFLVLFASTAISHQVTL